MKRLAVWLGAAAAAIVLLAIAAAAALPYLVDAPRVQSLIAQTASQALGRPVRFRDVTVRAIPRPSVELIGLEVAEDPRFGPGPFLSLDRGELRLRLLPLLGGRVEFGDLVLKKPLIRVVQDPSGRWNFATLGAAEATRPAPSRPRSGAGGGGSGSSAAAVLATRIKLDDGVVTYVSRARGGAASSYRLEDVDLTVTPAPGAIGIEGSAKVKPGDVAVKLASVTVTMNGGHTLTEAALRGRVTVEGKDVKDLVTATLGPEPAIGGGLKATLALGGTVGQPQASGDVELPGLRVTRTVPECPAPQQRSLAVDKTRLNVSWQNDHLVSRPLTTSIGSGTVTTNLTVTLEAGTHADAKDLAVKALPLDKILVDFLCQGYAVTGPLDLVGALAASPRDPWNTLSGSGQFRIGAGKVVGSQALRLLAGVAQLGGALSGALGKDAPVGAVGSPLEFDAITGSFQASRGVVTTRDLTYTSRSMKILIAGQYALGSGRMNLDVVLDHGRGQVQAKVTGSAASPAIAVNPTSVLRSVDPNAVESGLRDLLRKLR